MRLDECEREALRYSLRNYVGEVYLFGSRLNDTAKGGDIDILLLPKDTVNPLKCSLDIQTRFFSKCEEHIDVVVYREGDPFCTEVLKNAKKIDLTRI